MSSGRLLSSTTPPESDCFLELPSRPPDREEGTSPGGICCPCHTEAAPVERYGIVRRYDTRRGYGTGLYKAAVSDSHMFGGEPPSATATFLYPPIIFD